jgi:hypothetical protein
MLAVCIWVMAGTAMWHFGVLVPDRFYRGIIGALVAANAGAIAAGLTASGFTLPDTADLGETLAGLIGGFVGLTAVLACRKSLRPGHQGAVRIAFGLISAGLGPALLWKVRTTKSFPAWRSSRQRDELTDDRAVNNMDNDRHERSRAPVIQEKEAGGLQEWARVGPRVRRAHARMDNR